MFSDLAAWHSAVLYFAVTALVCAVVVGALPPFTLIWYASCCATHWPSEVIICGAIPLPRNSAWALLNPSDEAEEGRVLRETGLAAGVFP